MKLNYDKNTQLIPAIIQDQETQKVLMLGYMNKESYEKTLETGRVCFYSRSRKRLWTKGEESGNFLDVVDIQNDCDQDTLLIKVKPVGPVCHTGSDTCWNEENNVSKWSFIDTLESTIEHRRQSPTEQSYVASLFAKGTSKIAQKVGEEAVELVIEAMSDNDDLFKNEAADLLFHYLVLLQTKGMKAADIIDILRDRQK